MKRRVRLCGNCSHVFTPTGSVDFYCSMMCRLLASCDRSGDEDSCWEWTKGRDEKGYGSVARKNKNRTSAHRLMYELSHEVELPWEIVVRHICDNRPCINPKHLVEGSRKDNSDDMISRGREVHVRGTEHPKAILDDQTVLAIYNAEDTCENIATNFGINVASVWTIRGGTQWAHLTGGIRRQKASNAKLSEADVIAIFLSNEKNITLSKLYGVSDGTISMIRSGKLRGSITTKLCDYS